MADGAGAGGGWTSGGLNVNRALAGAAYRADVDGLRALAVVPVVLYHAGVPGFSGGYVGVDVFFVISGYLITAILARDIDAGRFSYLDFYERRARRILPALFVVLAATTLGAWLALFPDQLRDYGVHVVATLGFVANLVYMTEIGDYFSPDADYFPLLHMWSLGVEEQFYILFPVLLTATAAAGGAGAGTGARARARAAARRRVWIVAAVCAASFALAAWLERTAPVTAFYLTLTRVWELGLGALLALGAAPAVPRQGAAREALAALGLASTLAPVALYDAGTPFPGVAALAPCLGAALLIWVGGAGRPTLTSRLLGATPLVAAGLISYSLYLWHWPIMALSRAWLGTTELTTPQATATVAASVVLAALTWAVVERPFRDRRRMPPRTVWAVSAGGAAIFTAAAALLVVQPSALLRLAPGAERLAQSTEDVNPWRRPCLRRAVEDGLCAFGADTGAAADFVVWGDSHADALMPGFVLAAREAGLSGRIAMWPACPPLAGARRADRPDADADACVAHNAAMLDFLSASPDASVVYLVARWALVAEGARPAGEAGAPARLVDLETGAEGAEALEAGLARTVALIRGGGRRVVLVSSSPEFGWNVPLRLAAALRRGVPPPQGPDRAALRARNARVDAAFAALAAADPGVSVLRLGEALCPDDCPMLHDGRPIYRDGDHLSRHGAEAVAGPVIRMHLQRLEEG